MPYFLSPIPFPLTPIPYPCLLPPYPTHCIPKMKKKMCFGIQVIMNKTLTPINIVAPLFGRHIVLFKKKTL